MSEIQKTQALVSRPSVAPFVLLDRLAGLLHCTCTAAEFDFRHSNRSKRGINDKARAEKIIEGAKGKRLMYRRPEEGSLAESPQLASVGGRRSCGRRRRSASPLALVALSAAFWPSGGMRRRRDITLRSCAETPINGSRLSELPMNLSILFRRLDGGRSLLAFHSRNPLVHRRELFIQFF